MKKLGWSNDIGLFATAVIVVWISLGVLLWYFGTPNPWIFCSLLYVSFLGMVELSSGFGLSLPDQQSLDLAIGLGFVGWLVSVAVYFA
jgi:hypothetical protein